MPIHFRYADKSSVDALLPDLFNILYGNMNEIAPCGKPYAEQYKEWFAAVSPAMQKAPRQIILMLDGDEIIGYFQYYTREEMLMMEEIQIKKAYHGSGIFRQLYTWLIDALPDTLETVEAFADRRNTKSRAVLAHLGLCELEEVRNGILHFRGEYKNIKDKYQK